MKFIKKNMLVPLFVFMVFLISCQTHSFAYTLSFTDLDDGLTTVPAGWTENGGAPGGSRNGMQIISAGGPQYYTQSIPQDVNVSIEGVLSADALPAAGERGTRLWLTLEYNALFSHRTFEAHFERLAGGQTRVSLYDFYASAVAKAELDLDWTVVDPKIWIRLKRQQIGGEDTIVMEGGDDPNNPNPLASIQTPVSDFVATFGLASEVGFGNRIAGAYTSEWEYVLVADNLTAPVPEPATIALLGIGLVGLAGAEVRRRRKKKAGKEWDHLLR